MRMLLHICCGPCATYPVQYLRGEDITIYGYFDNPNIHPYREWLKRKETLAKYAEEVGLQVIYNENYQMEAFLQAVVHREAQRCRYCYAMRLEQAGRVARKGKFDCFSTTLLVSPYQNHPLIKETGEAVGEKYGVPFYYADFRSGYQEGVRLSREMEMYRQQYCGCIYSEKERFYK